MPARNQPVLPLRPMLAAPTIKTELSPLVIRSYGTVAPTLLVAVAFKVALVMLLILPMPPMTVIHLSMI